MLELKLIAAVSQNRGIGKDNNLPWRLKSEMAYFQRMTTATIDNRKKNVVIMGRKTWDSIPPKYKPLNDRINFVLSRSQLDVGNYKDAHAFQSFEEALQQLHDNRFKDLYESVWIVGGSHIYKEAMHSQYFYRLYLTEILKDFECDTFFPNIPYEQLKEISDPVVPNDVQEENGTQFVYKVYEKIKCTQ